MKPVQIFETPKRYTTAPVPYLELVDHMIASPVSLGLSLEWLFDYFDQRRKD
ncbi:hypothetical protein [Halocynthiibacter namhaensis]|uniref:hypothetical protein n=1 Tax=Halocynthiibacter namhaensis TaxID=1290553 RepID=UPI0012E074DB|nr:hypothetical protein [Halocynthiibacter namhaensis]